MKKYKLGLLLTKTYPDEGQIDYGYDAQNRLASTTWTREVSEGVRLKATRPLAIQKDGNWFTYGYDITKNVCEVFGPAGYIRTAYSYAPFGSVTESGDVTQPFQWSSEHYDSELDLVYYNYRHYSPSLGRFLSRDPIAEQGGLNLYAFVKNNPISLLDLYGRNWSGLVSPGLCVHAGNVVHYYSQCVDTCPEGAKLRDGAYGLKEYRSTEQSKLPSVNGCGPAGVLGFVVPDEFNYPEIRVKVSFTPACDIHDQCYGSCGAEKSQCDFNMFKGTVAECMKIGDQTTDHTKAKKDCLTKAFIFYMAISQLGKSFFESSQDEHCKWIPCRQ